MAGNLHGAVFLLGDPHRRMGDFPRAGRPSLSRRPHGRNSRALEADRMGRLFHLHAGQGAEHPVDFSFIPALRRGERRDHPAGGPSDEGEGRGQTHHHLSATE